VALVENPVAYLEAGAKALFANAALREALVTELSALPPPSAPDLPWGMTVTVQGATRVELAIPTSPGIPVGSELAAAASVVLDVKALSLTVGAIAWSPLAGSALAAQVSVPAGADPSWELDLAAAPTAAAPAAFDPIPLYARPAKDNQAALALA